MRLQSIAITSLLVILSAVAPAENLRKVAEANERGFIKAMKSKDISWFQKSAAPDFYEQEVNGKKSNATEALAEIKQMFSMGNISSLTTKILKVTKKGNGMIVRIDAHVAMTMQSPGDKKPSKMVSDSRYEELWSKDHGVWKIHWLKTLKDKTTLNGKPFTGGM